MLRPSYNQLINKVNEGCEKDEPVVRSRYSIVLAAAKRARQLVDGNTPYADGDVRKPLSLAVAELNEGKVRILPEGAVWEEIVEEVEESTEEAAEETVEEAVEEATEAVVVESEEIQL
ncbi:MAG: DNA-directed RNA polymerase subunit omega [Lachnospiraceae bacterium]|nr:DNA-directed RNA polymerase subunit omega [Lachnospiraceae bacterium]